MNLFDHIASQLAEQRNRALNELAEAQARFLTVSAQLKAAEDELAKLRNAPHPSDTNAVPG